MLKMLKIKPQRHQDKQFVYLRVFVFSRLISWQQKQTERDKRQLSLKRSGSNSIIGLVGPLPVLEPARLTENKN